MSSLQENLKPRSCLYRGLRFHCNGRTNEVNKLFIGGGSRPSDKGGGGGEEGGHPDPEIRGAGTGLQKKFFFWSKNKGKARAPRVPPLDPPLFIKWPF